MTKRKLYFLPSWRGGFIGRFYWSFRNRRFDGMRFLEPDWQWRKLKIYRLPRQR